MRKFKLGFFSSCSLVIIWEFYLNNLPLGVATSLSAAELILVKGNLD
jgi:hypothetical protein